MVRRVIINECVFDEKGIGMMESASRSDLPYLRKICCILDQLIIDFKCTRSLVGIKVPTVLNDIVGHYWRISN